LALPGSLIQWKQGFGGAMKITMMRTAGRSIAETKIRPRSFCLAIALIACASSSIALAAQSYEGPTFRKGMWRFERTLERSGPNTKVLVLQDMTRCVDPTNAMRATFASPDIGSCRSARPEKKSNQFIFSMRCDVLGPVRTEITVQSDTAYTELNEVAVGEFPRTDTVVARRIGDCKNGD
jgi:hypothetical protein